MFPNQFNVYLHDTPADSLFARASRSFSHGCVRLEQPMALAEYVLRDQPEWTRERIDEAMHAGEETHREAGAPIPGVPGLLDGAGVGRRRDAVPGGRLRHRRAPEALLAERLSAAAQDAAAAAAMAANRPPAAAASER